MAVSKVIHFPVLNLQNFETNYRIFHSRVTCLKTSFIQLLFSVTSMSKSLYSNDQRDLQSSVRRM